MIVNVSSNSVGRSRVKTNFTLLNDKLKKGEIFLEYHEYQDSEAPGSWEISIVEYWSRLRWRIASRFPHNLTKINQSKEKASKAGITRFATSLICRRECAKLARGNGIHHDREADSESC